MILIRCLDSKTAGDVIHQGMFLQLSCKPTEIWICCHFNSIPRREWFVATIASYFRTKYRLGKISLCRKLDVYFLPTPLFLWKYFSGKSGSCSFYDQSSFCQERGGILMFMLTNQTKLFELEANNLQLTWTPAFKGSGKGEAMIHYSKMESYDIKSRDFTFF